MSREIKFRAWIPAKEVKDHEYHSDGKAKMFYQDDQYLQSFLRRAYVEDCGREHESYISEGFTLLQFTGLKDKNGKEIYEGDICKVGDGGEHFGQDWNDDHEPFDTDVFQVYWDSKGALFYIKGLDGKDADLEFSPFGYASFEVIGNIYENPELLEGK